MDELLDTLMRLGLWLYGYCTDFIINLANITGTSYYEVNAFIFCFLWPLVTAGLLMWYVVLWVKKN